MLPALSTIASEQNNPTKNTMKWVKQLPIMPRPKKKEITAFTVSGMVLAIHSGAYYFPKKNAHSRVGGHHFLSSDK